MRKLRCVSHLGALPPNPRNFSPYRQNGWLGADAGCARSWPIPAAESALGMRSRSALSSAQVLPEWTTVTSPCNDFSSNGDYPLNFVSQLRGSLHTGSPSLIASPRIEPKFRRWQRRTKCCR
jgi:hypothetical protein